MERTTVPAGTTCAICLRPLVEGDDVLQEAGTDRYGHARCARRLISARGARLVKGDPRLIEKRAAKAEPVIPDLAKRYWRH